MNRKMTTQVLTSIADEALAQEPEHDDGGFAQGHVVERGDDLWFVKVPREHVLRDRAAAEQKLASEVRVGEGMRAAGFKKFIEPSWLAHASDGTPVLIRPAGIPLNSRDVQVSTLAAVERFLTDAEEAGWRVRDDIQLVRGRKGVFLTDLGEWQKARSESDGSELKGLIREAAHWAAGADESYFLTLPEIREHVAWVKEMERLGTMPENQAEIEREQWLEALEDRRENGFPVPADFERIVRRLSAA